MSERSTAACVAGERRGRLRALGVDPGTKRVGIAVSDSSGTIASPLTVLVRSRSRQHDLAEIARVAREEEVDVIVVGLPLNMDGSRGPSAEAATDVARRLASVTDVPVELHDERLTTVTAERSMVDAGVRGQERRQRVDKVAAAVMLQAWLDSPAAVRFRAERQ